MLRPFLALLSVPLIWGTYAPVTKYLNVQISSDTLVAVTFASHVVSAVVLLPFVRFAQVLDCVWVGIELGLYLCLGQILQVLSLFMIDASTNAVLVQLSCVIVSIVSVDKHGAHGVACACMCLLGAWLTCTDKNEGQNSLRGISLAIGAAVAYACHTRRLGDCADLHAVTNTFVQLLTCIFMEGVVLQLMLMGVPERLCDIHLRDHKNMTLVVWNGIFVGALSNLAMVYSQKYIDCTRAAIAYAMEPVIAIVVSYMVFHVDVTPRLVLGAFLIIASNVAMTNREGEVHHHVVPIRHSKLPDVQKP